MSEVGKGAAGGAAGGALTGAAVGTAIFPGIGTAIGAGIGAISGGISGALQGKARKKQKKRQKQLVEMQRKAIEAEQTKRDTNVGRVRDAFGVIPVAGEKNRDFGKALFNRANITGAIEQQADANRDAELTGNAVLASDANQQVTANLAGRGMLGSSVDANARKDVLSGYALGRSRAGAVAESTRQEGWNDVNNARRPLEATAATGADTSGLVASSQTLNDIGQAKTGIQYGTYTKMMGAALDGFGALARQNALGKQPETPGLLSMPRQQNTSTPAFSPGVQIKPIGGGY